MIVFFFFIIILCFFFFYSPSQRSICLKAQWRFYGSIAPLCLWRAEPKGAMGRLGFQPRDFQPASLCQKLRRLFVCGGAESSILCCLWAAFLQLFLFLFTMLVSPKRLSAPHEACCSSASVAAPKMRVCAFDERHYVYWHLQNDLAGVCLDTHTHTLHTSLQLSSLTQFARWSDVMTRCHF